VEGGPLNRLRRSDDAWRMAAQTRRTSHVPTSPLAQRLGSTPSLVPRFGSELRPIVGDPDWSVHRSTHVRWIGKELNSQLASARAETPGYHAIDLHLYDCTRLYASARWSVPCPDTIRGVEISLYQELSHADLGSMWTERMALARFVLRAYDFMRHLGSHFRVCRL
jgi:hypothetical protein